MKVPSFLDTSQKTAEEKCSFTKVTEKHCHSKSTQSFNENGLFSNIIDAAKAVIKERRKGVNKGTQAVRNFSCVLLSCLPQDDICPDE